MEFLYLSQSRTWARMSYQKGYPVTFHQDGTWQRLKGEKEFSICVSVPCTREQADSLFGGWNRRTTYNITAFDPITDTFGVSMFADAATVVGDEGVIDVDMLEQFLTDWGAVIDKHGSSINDVRFTLKAIDALEGKGYIYFGKEDDYVIFTESFYDSASGLHRIDADYSNSAIPEQTVRDTLAAANATLISIDHDKGLFTFETTRDIMKAKLEEAVRENFDTQVSLARYYLPESYVDAVKDAGGYAEESDFDTFRSKLIDKLGGI